MIKISRRIKTRKSISDLSNYEKKQLDNAIIDFLKLHESILYLPEDLRIELGLNFTPRSFVLHLNASRQKMGLLKVVKGEKSFYGFSSYCGRGICHYISYKNIQACPKGEPNPNLLFYERRGIYSKGFNWPDIVYGFNEIKLFKVEPGSVFPDHVNEYHHLMIVESGEGIFRLGGKKYQMKIGHVIAVVAGEMHGYKNVGKEDLKLIVCNTKPI